MTVATTRFDQLFAAAAPVLRAGTHRRESVPREGGRWPLSLVLVPGRDLEVRLDDLASAALERAGPGHWASGTRGSAHVTVTALEGYRAQVPQDDPRVATYAAALHCAVASCRPVSLRFTGLTLTPGSVMATAEPVDDSAESFREALRVALRDRLGPTGWSEWDMVRDIWYVNLVHFAGDLADAPALVDWVRERREVGLGSATLHAAELWRYVFAHGRPQRPQVLARSSLRR